MAKSMFGSAKKTETAKTTGTRSPIFVANEVRDNEGNVLFSQTDVVEAINKFCEGAELIKTGEGLQETNKPIVEAFARKEMAKYWVTEGNRPDPNPKVTTEASGEGVFINTIFQDKEVKLSEQEFDYLASVIGSDNAKNWTKNYTELTLNPEKLNIEVEINGETKLVQDIIDEAVSEAFAKISREDLLDGLLIAKDVFKTRKGLLDKLLAFVGSNRSTAVNNLEEALQAAKVTMQLKPGKLVKK